MGARAARLSAAVAIGLCCVLAAPAQGDPLGLRLGLMPYAPATEMIGRYGAVEDHLTAALDLRVRLVGAANYTAFVRALLAHDYDVVLTSPHIALLGLREAGWKPLVRIGSPQQTIVIVPRSSDLHTIADLQGHTVVTPDRLALVTLVFEEALERQRLVPGTHLTVQHTTSHENVVLLVSRGLADAGVTVPAQVARLPGRLRAQLRVLHEYPPDFEMVYMASPRLSAELRERVRDELLRMLDLPAGPGSAAGEAPAPHLPLDEVRLQRYGAFLPMLGSRLQEASKP